MGKTQKTETYPFILYVVWFALYESVSSEYETIGRKAVSGYYRPGETHPFIPLAFFWLLIQYFSENTRLKGRRLH